jgi:two-component system sensor histidine kinase UhpB
VAHDAATALLDLPDGEHVHRALPVLLLGFLAPFFAGNVRLFRSMSEFNQLLQTQLSERTAELEAAHVREKELVHAQALLSERQRIMRDMHDGLGSQLVSMLLSARRGVAKPETVAEGLQSVIDEMRLLIDSMDSVGESLGSALAMFRDRMKGQVEEAGMSLAWHDMSEGKLPELSPRDVLQVFRIMQEAVTNALKHSGGNVLSITISPGADPATALRLTIADDGQGMGRVNPRGKGQASMAARARSIGGTLNVRSAATGVQVILDVPSQ